MKRITISILYIIIALNLISCSKVVPPLGLPQKDPSNINTTDTGSALDSNHTGYAQNQSSDQILLQSDVKNSNTNGGTTYGTPQVTSAPTIDSDTV